MFTGVLKGIGGVASGPGRITKDVVAFHAADFTQLVQLLQLDLHEPPITQCVNWFVVLYFLSYEKELCLIHHAFIIGWKKLN